MKRVEFFATRNDILAVCEAVESVAELQYVLAGISASSTVTAVQRAATFPPFGVSNAGDAAHASRYLVAPADAAIRIRPVSQRKGGTLYAIDQLWNLALQS